MLASIRPVAVCLFAVGLFALIPAAVAAREGQGAAPAFLATTLACTFLAGAIHFTLGGTKARVRTVEALTLLAVLWLMVPLAAAPAIAASAKLPLLSAWLEAVSAFTTTGITAVTEASTSFYVWTALLQWSGGLLTVGTALAILAPSGLGGLPDRTARGGSGLDVVDARNIFRDVAPLYAGVTALVILAMMLTGHSFLVSFCLATAVASSGAHLPPEATLALALDASTKWVLLPALLWSATSVRWHRALVSRRLHAAPEQAESLTLLGYFAVLGVVLGAILFRVRDLSSLDAIRDGLFSAASLIATSGIGPTDNQYADLPAGIVLGAALIGGGALSVAGGLKIMRLRAILLRTRGDIVRLLYPNMVRPAVFGEGGMGSAMRGVWVGAATFFAVFAVVLIAVAAGLPSLEAALAAAVALISNTGPVYDLAGAGWPPLANMPPACVVIAGLAMVAGRLEIIGLLVVVHLAFWRT